MAAGIISFNYANWGARYPELAQYVDDVRAQMFFVEATLYCDNTASSPIVDATVGGQRDLLLGMLTAHIAALNADLGKKSPTLVGRINTATQGSVSVGTEMQLPPGSAQWYAQTKYGIAFWTATRRFRRFLYRGKTAVARIDPYGPVLGFPTPGGSGA